MNMRCPPSRRVTRILVINPNSSEDMTAGVATAIKELQLEHLIHVTLHTGPSTAPPSINNDEDIKASTDAILSDIDQGKLILDQYDGILIACYSVHSLVHEIRARLAPIAEAQGSPKHVTGIFEASVLTAQLLIGPPSDEKWGIVTTGKFWEEHLTHGVKGCLGQASHEHNANFGGVFTTGLTAGDFHKVPPEEVEKRLTKATKLLLESGKVTCVVMGCAGMAGLENIIRSAAAELNGGKEVGGLHVVDGVKAGVMQLDQSIRSRQIFGPSHTGGE